MPLKLTKSKRPRRAQSKKLEEDEDDPYIYTGGVIMRAQGRRRRLGQ